MLLQTKHVQIDNICLVCHEEAESVFHSLVQCKAATLCWQIHNPNISTNETMEFAEWLERNLSGQPKQATAKIITLCWSIWRARNDLVWSNKSWNSMKIIAKAWEYLSQWTTAQEVMNPTLTEALAIKEVLSWAKEWTEKTTTTESDCLVVIQLIRSATSLRSRLGKVIMECRTLVRELNNVRLYFIKRFANMSAHELAHVSRMYPDRVFDWGSIPVNVQSCISNESLE
ncbi:uncharacterized protein LOC141686484 [Apium graveolens]|uniref:uncharacterized protein LOC141686484 n=1 Tax=Apium graveolens TaxID=4045 RepID=UPI003D796FB1